MEGKTFKGIKIAVDCIKNDPVDVRCGGPRMLGYDFIVREEEKDEMMKFIKETIEEFGLPLESIYVWGEGDYPIDSLWTKERVIAEIPKYHNMIISESRRHSR